jgi:hypothetical protein
MRKIVGHESTDFYNPHSISPLRDVKISIGDEAKATRKKQ